MEYPTTTALASCIPGLEEAQFIQAGGQKAVYRAHIKGQAVALKMISIDAEALGDGDISADVEVVLKRAQREVGILDQVDVPVLARRGPLGLSTVQIDDCSWLYFTEEWIAGESLRDQLRRRRLSPVCVARLGVDLIQAVCWLAARGLVHRDIKPANVMWAENRSRFVLVDPGIALDLGGLSLTRMPMIVGTIAYLSPEQMDPYRKRTLDFRSDLFSVGIVMYEAALGEHPFTRLGTTPSEILAGIITDTPQPLAEKIHGFPIGLSDVIARLLGKAAHLRYRTCERAQSAIGCEAEELGVIP